MDTSYVSWKIWAWGTFVIKHLHSVIRNKHAKSFLSLRHQCPYQDFKVLNGTPWGSICQRDFNINIPGTYYPGGHFNHLVGDPFKLYFTTVTHSYKLATRWSCWVDEKPYPTHASCEIRTHAGPSAETQLICSYFKDCFFLKKGYFSSI